MIFTNVLRWAVTAILVPAALFIGYGMGAYDQYLMDCSRWNSTGGAMDGVIYCGDGKWTQDRERIPGPSPLVWMTLAPPLQEPTPEARRWFGLIEEVGP